MSAVKSDGLSHPVPRAPVFNSGDPLLLRVPQTRDGSFCPEIFQRYRRSEQAFVLSLMEMVLNGVSTRQVTEITEVPAERILQIDRKRACEGIG